MKEDLENLKRNNWIETSNVSDYSSYKMLLRFKDEQKSRKMVNLN